VHGELTFIIFPHERFGGKLKERPSQMLRLATVFLSYLKKLYVEWETGGRREYPRHNQGTGHAVTQLFEALRYKPEVCGFDSRWCQWNFSLT
jgi:hypothetical protein